MIGSFEDYIQPLMHFLIASSLTTDGLCGEVGISGAWCDCGIVGLESVRLECMYGFRVSANCILLFRQTVNSMIIFRVLLKSD